MAAPAPTIDLKALTKQQLWEIAKHYSDVVEVTLKMNNILIQRRNDMGLTSGIADAINEWSTMVNGVMAASGGEVERIIEPVPPAHIPRH